MRAPRDWRFSSLIEEYIELMFAEGRFNSPATEKNVRLTLGRHAEDVKNHDPRTTNRDDVRRTLSRWQKPNTRSLHHSHLAAFYDFMLEEGYRKDNPARQTRRPKTRKPEVYRLTREEVQALRDAARGMKERRAIDTGLLVGLRANELCGLQGRHFRRPGWVWVSADIAKGNRERWVPVLPEYAETWQEIAESVGDEEYVIPKTAQSFAHSSTTYVVDPLLPTAYATLHRLVRMAGRRAGIKADIHPHLLRHAYGDHIARFADMRVAQFVLGHSTIRTTERYTGEATLEEVAQALRGFGYSPSIEGVPTPLSAPHALLAPESSVRGARAVLEALFASQGLRQAARDMA